MLKRNAMWLFLLGCFSITQINVIGYIGISELICYALAPFLFVSEKNALISSGMMKYLMLAIIWAVFAVLTDISHGREWTVVLKGVAPVYCFFSISVCTFALLKKDVRLLKYLLFGVACSFVISTFIFQPGSDRVTQDEVLSGLDAIENRIGYKLYWVAAAENIVPLPVKTAFLSWPLPISIVLVIITAGVSLLSGGRSGFLACLSSVFILAWGGGIRRNRNYAKKGIFGLLIVLAVSGVLASSIYKLAVTHGLMGEREHKKYDTQIGAGGGPLAVIMRGRGDFFVGLIAALDAPIMGHGSMALDYKGYRVKYLEKYGDDESIEYMEKMNRQTRSTGGMVWKIPAHSHIIQAWMWHGLGGLFFWCYVLFIVLKTFRVGLFVVPELFGYFALSLPSFLWKLLFSPMGDRVGTAVLITSCIIVLHLAKQRRLASRDIYFPNGGGMRDYAIRL